MISELNEMEKSRGKKKEKIKTPLPVAISKQQNKTEQNNCIEYCLDAQQTEHIVPVRHNVSKFSWKLIKHAHFVDQMMCGARGLPSHLHSTHSRIYIRYMYIYY